MKQIKLMFLGLAFFLFGFQNITAQNSPYIREYAPLANELSQKYGIPAELILSVAYVESGGGNSKLARLANNHFGIVGKNEVYNSRYRSYSSAKESFESFCRLVTRKKFYESLKGSSNVQAWVTHLAKAGYSSNPSDWKNKIISTVKKFW